MRKCFKGLAMVLVLALVLALLPTAALAADGSAGREAQLYQLLLEGIRDKRGLDGKSYIDLSALRLCNEDGSPDRDMLWTVFDRVFYDHPELFYLREGYYRVSGDKSYVLGIRPMYASVAQDADAQARFDVAVNTALAQIDGLTDPVEQMLALYQYLIRTTAYNYDVAIDQSDNAPEEAWTAYGALVTGDTVCKGYAMAWKVLMDRIKIPCLVVCKGDKSHLWNMVQLDGKWYHVDVNRGNNYIPVLRGQCAYTDFLVTDDAMSKHESWYVPGTSYRDAEHYDTFPACTDEKYSKGWVFRQTGMFYPMYRDKSGQYYYVRQINAKTAKLYCGPLMGTGKELASLTPYTLPWGNGYRISSGMVWVEDCLYFVNADLKLMRYCISDGKSVSLGKIPFTLQATADRHFDQRYDGVSLVFDAHAGMLSARSRSRGTDLKTWQIAQPQPNLPSGSQSTGTDFTPSRNIDHLQRQLPDYALGLYHLLEEATDNDGVNDYLIEDKYFTAGTTKNLLDDNPKLYDVVHTPDGSYLLVAIINKDDSEASKANSELRTAIDLFEIDHPDVFLRPSIQILDVCTTSSAGNKTHHYFLCLSNLKTSFDIRSGYTERTFQNDCSKMNASIDAILAGMPEGGAAEKVKYFNQWLTTHNDYNTESPAPIISNRSISALFGSTGANGPVCVGYSFALKVLCDRADIPCLVIIGSAGAAFHAWNYVQIDGAWYAVDVTWNDPPVADQKGNRIVKAASGYEKEEYLLVGKNTLNRNGKSFEISHNLDQLKYPLTGIELSSKAFY